MGAGGATNQGTNHIECSKLSKTGKPNSKAIRLKNGQIVQVRWYDKNGKAIKNRDYSHAGKGVEFPHDHGWSWQGENGQRGAEHLDPDYDNFN